MITELFPDQYIAEQNLWDLEQLKAHAQAHSVYVIESVRFPNVVMLHYKDEVQYDNKWTEFNRMCRGLILDMKNKKVIAHPFNKFFNLGQMPETSYESLASLGNFQTSEKLDGSMIVLFKDPNTGKLTFTTKCSLDSEHAAYANSLQMPSGFWETAAVYNSTGTLIFELVAKKFQIVIDYAKKGYSEGLYLIGYRDQWNDNRLVSYDHLKDIASDLGVPVFKTYEFRSLDTLIETAKGLPVLEEGYVLRFENDLLVKVKGNAYLEMHRFISHLSDRNILESVGNGTAYKLLELCPEEYRDEVKNKIEHFENRLKELTCICNAYYINAPKETRKEFALHVNQNVEQYLRGCLFTLMDKKQLELVKLCRIVEEIDHVDGRTKI